MSIEQQEKVMEVLKLRKELKVPKVYDDMIINLTEQAKLSKNDITKYLYIVSRLFSHEMKEIITAKSVELSLKNQGFPINIDILHTIFGNRNKSINILKDCEKYDLIEVVNQPDGRRYNKQQHISTHYKLKEYDNMYNDVQVYKVCTEIYTVKGDVRERKYLSKNGKDSKLNGYNVNFVTRLPQKRLNKISATNQYELFNLSYMEVDETLAKSLSDDHNQRLNHLREKEYNEGSSKLQREFTSFTFIPSKALHCLKHTSGEDLYELDIRSCHSYLAAELTGDQKLIDYLKDNDIYSNIAKLTNQTRNEIKQEVQENLYGNYWKNKLIKDFFQTNFPKTFYNFFNRYNGNTERYKAKAHIMMRREAKKFKLIKEELMKKHIFFLSRFDSLTTIESQVQDVYDVLSKHFPEMIVIKKINKQELITINN